MTNPLTPLEYWTRTVADPRWPDAVSAMLQSADAHDYATDERDATLAFLPDGSLGRDGVELGCGIGRYTVHLARRVERLFAMDLVPASVEATRRACSNAGLAHVTVEVSDAADYHPAPSSIDLLFVKWVLMYLDDAQADGLIRRLAVGLRPGGVLLVHDSADPGADRSPHAANEVYAPDYPGRYRHPDWYHHRLMAAGPWRSVRRGDLGAAYPRWSYPPGAQPVWVLTRGNR